jgi:NodT family efflux transporter outer membrane factor (OMF) lipoprotein
MATYTARYCLTLLAILALCSCAVGPNYHRPAVATPAEYKEGRVSSPTEAQEGSTRSGDSPARRTPSDGAPANTHVSGNGTEVPSNTRGPAAHAQDEAGAAATSAPALQWWTLFGDPVLDDLERQVEVSNQNLAAAEAAYREALTVIREQRAALFPLITVDADASHTKGASRNNVVTRPGETSNTRSPNSYQLTAGATWEIDLWGRLRRALENAKALADASGADLAAAKLSLQGQLATAYLQLREADAEQRLVAQTVSAYSRSLQIAQNRYDAGVAAKTDVLQARTQLANAQDQGVALQLQRARLEHAIASLIGKPPGDFTLMPVENWQQVVPDVPFGVPSTLLQRRPDIAAAERRVAAANASIGVEEAAYFPSLTLTAARGFLSTTVGSLFNTASEARSIGATASQTLLDFGTRRARVAGARAAYDQAVAQYRQSVLTAFQDVEDNLASSDLLAQQYKLRREASEAADETEQLTMNQYKAGTVSYTNVIVAQTAALDARRSLATIALDRQTTAVALITALGGGWTAPVRTQSLRGTSGGGMR